MKLNDDHNINGKENKSKEFILPDCLAYEGMSYLMEDQTFQFFDASQVGIFLFYIIFLFSDYY